MNLQVPTYFSFSAEICSGSNLKFSAKVTNGCDRPFATSSGRTLFTKSGEGIGRDLK